MVLKTNTTTKVRKTAKNGIHTYMCGVYSIGVFCVYIHCVYRLFVSTTLTINQQLMLNQQSVALDTCINTRVYQYVIKNPQEAINKIVKHLKIFPFFK